MIRIHTDRIVATMQHRQVIGDRPFQMLPRIAMSIDRMLRGSLAGEVKLPVAFNERGRPDPTRPQFRTKGRPVFLDLCPEACYKGLGGPLTLRSGIARLLAVAALDRARSERRATVGAL